MKIAALGVSLGLLVSVGTGTAVAGTDSVGAHLRITTSTGAVQSVDCPWGESPTDARCVVVHGDAGSALTMLNGLGASRATMHSYRADGSAAGTSAAFRFVPGKDRWSVVFNKPRGVVVRGSCSLSGAECKLSYATRAGSTSAATKPSRR